MKILDITMPIHPKMLVWPKDPAPVFKTIQTLKQDGNVTSLVRIGTHIGTHIDAPRHFVKGGKSVDVIDLSALIGPCEVIEVPDGLKTVNAEFLKKHRAVRKSHSASRLLFKTRNSRMKLLRRRKFEQNFVGLAPDAADFLVKAKIQLIGVDYLSCERPPQPTNGSNGWFVHKKLLSAGIIIVESCNLSDVKPGTYELTVLPLRLQGLDGSPCRAILKTS